MLGCSSKNYSRQYAESLIVLKKTEPFFYSVYNDIFLQTNIILNFVDRYEVTENIKNIKLLYISSGGFSLYSTLVILHENELLNLTLLIQEGRVKVVNKSSHLFNKTKYNKINELLYNMSKNNTYSFLVEDGRVITVFSKEAVCHSPLIFLLPNKSKILDDDSQTLQDILRIQSNSSTTTGKYIDIDTLVNTIKNTPGYNDFDTIDLIACNTGKGGDDSFAKKLAKALNKQVKAPDCEMIVYSNGFYTLKNPNGKYVKYE